MNCDSIFVWTLQDVIGLALFSIFALVALVLVGWIGISEYLRQRRFNKK